jgi:thioredoxin reductase (NADPH)
VRAGRPHRSTHNAALSDLFNPVYALYALPFIAVLVPYLVHRYRLDARYRRELDDAVSSGMTEPPSLHPIIDPIACIGSAACVKICPEQALGIIAGKAQLVNAAACIGHGACAEVCPVEAIKLVFGTAKRGIDIPLVNPNFETNVPGVYIAGELGGMGLVRKASEQGRQAMASIAKRARTAAPLDVVIVGAGPAGIAAALGAVEHKLRYRLIEQEPDLGGAVFHYPRNKIAMTAPFDLAVVGRVNFREVSKEALLAFWHDIVARAKLEIQFGTRMERIEPKGSGFRVQTSKEAYECGALLLTIGRRGTPRKLGAPGEELPKVVYRLIEAEQYRGQRVLVVGGGDSAVEAALACAEQPDTTVTIAYRGDAFSRIKAKNRDRIDAASAEKRIDVRLKTDVEQIFPDRVVLKEGDASHSIGNDAVIVQAGGELPTKMLRDLGITVETRHGEV